MKVEVYNRIVGYLDALTNIISFYGVLYSYTYKFIEYDNVSSLDECAERFFNESPISKHGTRFDSLRELDDWRSDCLSRAVIGSLMYSACAILRYPSRMKTATQCRHRNTEKATGFLMGCWSYWRNFLRVKMWKYIN